MTVIPFKDLHSREYQGHKKKGKVKDVELKGHTDSVDRLCWDPKHSYLIATASGDKTVGNAHSKQSKVEKTLTLRPSLMGRMKQLDDELTILDVRKFKPIHKRKFNYEVNEIAWNMSTGNGMVEVLAYPSLRPIGTLMAHTPGCYCIAIDPVGRWPVRTIIFNRTGEYIASASEDLFIDIVSSGYLVSKLLNFQGAFPSKKRRALFERDRTS